MKRERYKVDLKSMLADCEANYVRLRRLFPDMMSATERGVGLGGGGHTLMLSVLERTSYTTLLELTQGGVAQAQRSVVRSPRLKVRLYHDAKLAEVTTCQRINYIQSNYDYPNEHMVQPDEKFQWNHFLGEWLANALAHGYVLEEACLSP